MMLVLILTIKADMLKSLQRRFDNIEEIDELSIATILHPQFKDKFSQKTETKQSARKFLIDNYNFSEHASSTTDLSGDSAELPRKWLRSDSSSTTDTNTTSTKDDAASSAPCSSKI